MKINEIKKWDEIKDLSDEKYLLLGNGFSQCFSEKFEQNLFEKLGTQSWLKDLRVLFKEEKVPPEDIFNSLYNLSLYAGILKVLNKECSEAIDEKIKDYEQKIKTYLIKELKEIHPQRDSFLKHVPDAFFNEVEKFDSIFTTNYDLLLYWIILKINKLRGKNVFKDYFWTLDGCYDPNDNRLIGKGIHYLHGAFHLNKLSHYRTYKQKYSAILKIEEIIERSRGLTCITLGNYREKKEKITEDLYLHFCLEKLKEVKGSLVIFGHSLNPKYDQHIIDAIKDAYRKTKGLKLYISIFENKDLDSIKNSLSGVQIVEFFDAKTHPFYQLTNQKKGY